MKEERSKRIFLAGISFVFILGILGCAEMSSSRMGRDRPPEAAPPVVGTYRFDDIPLPPGMVLNRGQSFLYESGSTKTGLLVYDGKGEVNQLAAFFKRQMPGHQWRLLSHFELRNAMLCFIKEGWVSVIYMLPQDGDVRIEIRVGPVEIKFSLPPKT